MQTPKSKRKLVIAAGTTLLFIVVIVMLRACKPAPPPVETSEQARLVDTAQLALADTGPSAQTIALVSAASLTQLKSQVTGDVMSVSVEAGQAVALDQTLLTINPVDADRLFSQAQAQVNLTQATFDQAKAQHQANLAMLSKERELAKLAQRSADRYKQLVAKNLATAEQLDQANETAFRQDAQVISRQANIDSWPSQQQQLEAQLLIAKSQLEQVGADRDRALLKSPFAAYVHKLHVAPGARVSTGQLLVELYQGTNLRVQANVPAVLLASLDPAQPRPDLSATAMLDGALIQFELVTIAQSQSANGTRQALFKPVDPDLQLPLGRALELTMQVNDSAQAMAIPVAALHEQRYIYLLTDDNHLKRQRVQRLGDTYRKGRRWYLIKADSALLGRRYVSSQLIEVVNGMQVSPVSGDQ